MRTPIVGIGYEAEPGGQENARRKDALAVTVDPKKKNKPQRGDPRRKGNLLQQIALEPESERLANV
jgi:hypothetical protein